MRSTKASIIFALITTTGVWIGGCDPGMAPSANAPTPTTPPITTTSTPEQTVMFVEPDPPECSDSCTDLGVCGNTSCDTPCNDSNIIIEEGQKTRICFPTSCARFGGCVDGPADSPTPGGGSSGGDSGNGGCSWQGLPNVDEVYLYEHANFQGQCAAVRRSQSWTENSPFMANDTVSSMRIGPGVKIELFDDINFGGSLGTWTGPGVSYVGDAANDRMSSYKISRQ